MMLAVIGLCLSFFVFLWPLFCGRLAWLGFCHFSLCCKLPPINSREELAVGFFERLKQKNFRLFKGTDSDLPLDSRTRILFVSHEATRTGAPLITLNLLRHFARYTDIRLDTILHNGGELVDSFIEYSTVACLNLPRKSSDTLNRRIRKIVTGNRQPLPALAICNSMESRFIAQALASQNIPILFLIHELPTCYTAADYQMLFDISGKVVFPIETVRDETAKIIELPEGKTLVQPQGLLDPDFGKGLQRDRVRVELRRELNIPEQAQIVLGCGTLDLRKGIDHFAGIARETLRLEKSETAKPFHFVWVGGGPRWPHSPHYYVTLDLQKYGIADRVHFVEERHNVAPFFFGSDIFLLPSRVDPFPCVVHEAMAAQLPIVTFDLSGGAATAIRDGAGVVIPYGDYQQAAQMINLLNSQKYLAKSIRDGALERVNSEYCFADYAKKIAKIAESVAAISFNDPDQKDYLPFAA